MSLEAELLDRSLPHNWQPTSSAGNFIHVCVARRHWELTNGIDVCASPPDDSPGASASQSITIVVGVRGNLQVLPSAIDPAGTGNVTAIVTLPPGMQTTDIDTASLHVHIGNTELTPLTSAQLGDTNADGLPELKLTLDGQATRAALGASQTQAVGAPLTQVEVDLSGSMNDSTALAASGSAALITPGDVDCSGGTDGTDVTLTLAYNVNLGSPDCLFAGDMNCDGEVTVMDALGILGHMAGVTISAASCPVPSAATAVLTTQGLARRLATSDWGRG